MEKIQSHAKLVVVGGGILGVSLLYHLTKEGWKDIVLIEKVNLLLVQLGMQQASVHIWWAVIIWLKFISIQLIFISN